MEVTGDNKDKNEYKNLVVTEANFPSHITVKFITNTYPDKITETPFKVPSDLTRFGLSEIVNHLLGKESEPIPFEFLIEFKVKKSVYSKDTNKDTNQDVLIENVIVEDKKVFLRTSLRQFFMKINKYPESTLVLEYLEAQPSPKEVDTIPHDDWVCAISSSLLNDRPTYATGCYDGVLRIIDSESGSIIATGRHRGNGVRRLTMKTIANEDSNTEYALLGTCCSDNDIRIWKYENSKLKLKTLLSGHNDIVEDVDLNNKGNLMASGSRDKSIKIWDVKQAIKVQDKLNQIEPTAKKMRIDIDEKKPLIGSLEGHILPISCVEWVKSDQSSQAFICSGSFDHTLRIWDITKAACASLIQGSKVISALSANHTNMILSAHPDHVVRLWDSRVKSNQVARAAVYKSHKGWVRDVEWNPLNENQFVSCADDNLVKVWDTRSSLPLHSFPHHTLDTPKEEEQTMEEEKELTEDERKTKEISALRKPKIEQRLEQHKVLASHWSISSNKEVEDTQRSLILLTGSTDCTMKKHSIRQISNKE